MPIDSLNGWKLGRLTAFLADEAKVKAGGEEESFGVSALPDRTQSRAMTCAPRETGRRPPERTTSNDQRRTHRNSQYPNHHEQPTRPRSRRGGDANTGSGCQPDREAHRAFRQQYERGGRKDGTSRCGDPAPRRACVAPPHHQAPSLCSQQPAVSRGFSYPAAGSTA
jgi:hypothetical protein